MHPTISIIDCAAVVLMVCLQLALELLSYSLSGPRDARDSGSKAAAPGLSFTVRDTEKEKPEDAQLGGTAYQQLQCEFDTN